MSITETDLLRLSRRIKAVEDLPGIAGEISLSEVGAITLWPLHNPPDSWLLCDGASVSRTTYADLFGRLCRSLGNAVISIASPAMVTLPAHGLLNGDSVFLTTTGALPTGFAPNTLYYVRDVSIDAFRLSLTRDGTAIGISGTQSGAHTVHACPWGVNDAGTFNLPNLKGRAAVGKNPADGVFNNLGETNQYTGGGAYNLPPYVVLNFIIRYRSYSAPKKGEKGDKGEKGEKGAAGINAPHLSVQYSADGQRWHTGYLEGDGYVRLSTDGGNVWGGAVYIRGDQGRQGPQGKQGIPGLGIPAGGITGQVLSKKTDSDLDTQWADAAPVVAPAVDNVNNLSEDGTISIWKGTQVEYDTLGMYRDDTLYIISDDQTAPSVPFTLDSMPVGFNMPWWSDVLPSLKYMFMEGQLLVGYPYAKAVFGDTLPDLRGRVMVHKGTYSGLTSIGNTGGNETHILSANEMPAHGHNIGHGGGGGDGVIYPGGTDNVTFGYNPDSVNAGGNSYRFTALPQGNGQAHNNLQPYIVCRYIAKVVP